MLEIPVIHLHEEQAVFYHWIDDVEKPDAL